jgi:CRP-like cAMP-binding protein
MHHSETRHRHVFIKRLSDLHDLSAAEERALLEALGPASEVTKGQDIVAEGDSPPHISVVVTGAACRYKILAGGQRQILGFVLAGDLADEAAADAVVIDHGVSASTDCVIERLSRSAFQRAIDLFPNLAVAVRRYWLLQGSLYRSWLTHTRRRTAAERLAHLLCEQFARLQVVGLAEHGRPVPLHIVQSDLADASGMSTIHVNRTLQDLRRQKLVGRDPTNLEILDWERLQELAEFDPSYLHPYRSNCA